MAGINGIIFDFDGLIVDTESIVFNGWQNIFQEFGTVLQVEEWAVCLGTSENGFDPAVLLEQKCGQKLDLGLINKDFELRTTSKILASRPRPGIENLLQEARQAGFKIGLASSSSRTYIDFHLERLGLSSLFDCLVTSNDVVTVKPDPSIYRQAIQKLGLEPSRTIALEDSPNGILAAKAAGIFCFAVPNSVSACLDLSKADFCIQELDHYHLTDLCQIAGS